VGGAGERRADLVVSGVVEYSGDVRVRADDPDLVRTGAEGAREVELVEAEDPDRAGHGRGGRPRRIDVRAGRHEQQEPVPRDLAESSWGS
jgi:hypothetical protein